MTPAMPFRRTIITLWLRAPLWRFSITLAIFLSCLFVLFPPQHKDTVAPPVIPQQAEYIPQPTPVASSTPSLTAKQSLTDDNTDIDLTLLGKLYSGSIDVGGFNVPLPEGKWAILANMGLDSPRGSGMGYFLGRIEHKHLAGAAIIYGKKAKTPSDDLTHEMILGHGCDFPNALYTYNDGPVNDHFSCWYTHSLFSAFWQQWNNKAAKINTLERVAAENMATMSISYPQDLGSVVFLHKEEHEVLYVTYYFSPEAEGIMSNKAAVFGDSDWAPGNIHRFPEKLAFMEKLKTWGNGYWPRFKATFERDKPFP